jgi:hypothetical protein
MSSPPTSDEEPARRPEAGEAYPSERQTRLSGAWTALVIGVLALAVILVFILQNLQTVEVHFIVFQGSLPLAVALLFRDDPRGRGRPCVRRGNGFFSFDWSPDARGVGTLTEGGSVFGVRSAPAVSDSQPQRDPQLVPTMSARMIVETA